MDDAFARAYEHAGINQADTTAHESELDEDNGRLIWELEFDAGERDYDYDIDATTGEVIKAD